MTLKSFLIGMLASFGLAWMCMIAIPAAKMSKLPAVRMAAAEEDSPYYERRVSGRLLNGAQVYASNGCYTCHSQLNRPTYAGTEVWIDDAAGMVDEDGNDSRRETSVNDYEGEKYAQLGLQRVGQDLSNFGYRAERYAKEYTAATKESMTAEQWLLAHLKNPRDGKLRRGEKGEVIDMSWSTCPSQPQLFNDGRPNEQADALVSYLLSMKRDDQMPDSMNYAKKKEDKKKK